MSTSLIQQLRDARIRAKITQSVLAERIGISKAAVGMYESERRRVPIKLAETWAAACGHRLDVGVVAAVISAPASDADRDLLDAIRHLAEPDRDLVERLIRALPGTHPSVRNAIACLTDQPDVTKDTK